MGGSHFEWIFLQGHGSNSSFIGKLHESQNQCLERMFVYERESNVAYSLDSTRLDAHLIKSSNLCESGSARLLPNSNYENIFEKVYRWYDDPEIRPPIDTFNFPFVSAEQLSMILEPKLDDVHDSNQSLKAHSDGGMIHILGVAYANSENIGPVHPVIHMGFTQNFLDPLKTRNELYLAFIAVDPACRQLGLGTRGLRLIDTLAEQLKCSHIKLHAPCQSHTDFSYERFYATHGYTFSRKVYRYYRHKYDAVEMFKFPAA